MWITFVYEIIKKPKFADNMELTLYLLNHLKKYNRTEISGFGVFSLVNTGATISSEHSILPPAKEIIFVPDEQIRNREFIQFLEKQSGLSDFEAELELKKVTNKWKSLLESGQDFELENLGSFHLENGKMMFKGLRISDPEPDFYGLEEIKLSEIHSSIPSLQSKEKNKGATDYSFRKGILWVFLVAIPIAGIIFLSICYPEFIFGKRSNLTVKNSTHRIENKPAVDSLKNKAVSDTIVADSLKTEAPKVLSK